MRLVPDRWRQRVVHGWTYMDLPLEERQMVIDFMNTGDPEVLPERFRAKAREHAQRFGREVPRG